MFQGPSSPVRKSILYTHALNIYISISIYLSMYLSIRRSIYRSIYLSIRRSIYISIYLVHVGLEHDLQSEDAKEHQARDVERVAQRRGRHLKGELDVGVLRRLESASI